MIIMSWTLSCYYSKYQFIHDIHDFLEWNSEYPWFPWFFGVKFGISMISMIFQSEIPNIHDIHDYPWFSMNSGFCGNPDTWDQSSNIILLFGLPTSNKTLTKLNLSSALLLNLLFYDVMYLLLLILTVCINLILNLFNIVEFTLTFYFFLKLWMDLQI